MTQVFIPLCGLLWPMGYLHVWVEGDGCEALRACTKYHKTCVGELLLLCSAYLLMVFPTIAFAVIMFHLSWLEYMRLALQFSIIINFLYFMIMLLKKCDDRLHPCWQGGLEPLCACWGNLSPSPFERFLQNRLRSCGAFFAGGASGRIAVLCECIIDTFSVSGYT